MGGVVAYEMAQRLRAAGRRSGSSPSSGRASAGHPCGVGSPSCGGDCPGAGGETADRQSPPSHAHGRVLLQRPSRQQTREVIDRIKRLFTIASAGDPLRGVRGEVYRQMSDGQANSAAMGRYHPQPYPGSLVLVLAADRRYTRGSESTHGLAWSWPPEEPTSASCPAADSGLTLVRAQRADTRRGVPRAAAACP